MGLGLSETCDIISQGLNLPDTCDIISQGRAVGEILSESKEQE